MKLKYYLRGLGVGIIFTTIILAISFHIHGDSSRMTDEEIIAAAKKLGMVESGSRMKDRTKEDTQSTQNTQSTESTQGQDNTQKNDTQSTTQIIENSQKPEDSVFTITTNDNVSWRMVGNKLAEAGIIPSGEEFYKYYNEHYPDAYLQNGTHEIPVGSDLDTIIQILSTKK